MEGSLSFPGIHFTFLFRVSFTKPQQGTSACVYVHLWLEFDYIFTLVTERFQAKDWFVEQYWQIALEEVFWYSSINTSTTGCEVCIVMVKKLCSSLLPGVSWQSVLIIEVQPLVRSWKADSVALYLLDMVDLAAETCLFTHPDNISIHLEMCLQPQGEFMSNI